MKFLIFIGKGKGAPSILLGAAKALESLGHEVQFYIVKEGPVVDLKNVLDSFKPDLVISLDHFGLDDDLFIQRKQSYLSWFVDHPIYFDVDKSVNPYHRIAYTDQSFISKFKEWGYKDLLYLPLAADIISYPPKDHNPTKNVGWVSSYFGPSIEMTKERQQLGGDLLMNWCDKVREKWFSISDDQNLENLIKSPGSGELPFSKLYESLPLANQRQLFFFLDKEIDSINKEQLWEKLKTFEPHLIGDESWQKFDSQMKNFLGLLEYDVVVQNFYNSCKIQIVTFRPQLERGVNQRVFDVPIQGGLPLCQNHKGIKEIFPGYCDQILLNLNQPQETIEHWLDNDTDRNKLVSDLRQEVIQNHTYTHRMKKLMRYL